MWMILCKRYCVSYYKKDFYKAGVRYIIITPIMGIINSACDKHLKESIGLRRKSSYKLPSLCSYTYTTDKIRNVWTAQKTHAYLTFWFSDLLEKAWNQHQTSIVTFQLMCNVMTRSATCRVRYKTHTQVREYIIFEYLVQSIQYFITATTQKVQSVARITIWALKWQKVVTQCAVSCHIVSL